MGTKLFIGNLNYHTTEESLRAHFATDGRNVAQVKIVTDRETGRSRGFGFVEMATEEDARGAMDALNGSTVDGRPIRVDAAHDRPRRQQSRGWGVGGGFGDRRRY